jgi:hypothetical protein
VNKVCTSCRPVCSFVRVSSFGLSSAFHRGALGAFYVAAQFVSVQDGFEAAQAMAGAGRNLRSGRIGERRPCRDPLSSSTHKKYDAESARAARDLGGDPQGGEDRADSVICGWADVK